MADVTNFSTYSWRKRKSSIKNTVIHEVVGYKSSYANVTKKKIIYFFTYEYKIFLLITWPKRKVNLVEQKFYP